MFMEMNSNSSFRKWPAACATCSLRPRMARSRLEDNWWFGPELDDEVRETLGFKDLQREETEAVK